MAAGEKFTNFKNYLLLFLFKSSRVLFGAVKGILCWASFLWHVPVGDVQVVCINFRKP